MNAIFAPLIIVATMATLVSGTVFIGTYSASATVASQADKLHYLPRIASGMLAQDYRVGVSGALLPTFASYQHRSFSAYGQEVAVPLSLTSTSRAKQSAGAQAYSVWACRYAVGNLTEDMSAVEDGHSAGTQFASYTDRDAATHTAYLTRGDAILTDSSIMLALIAPAGATPVTTCADVLAGTATSTDTVHVVRWAEAKQAAFGHNWRPAGTGSEYLNDGDIVPSASGLRVYDETTGNLVSVAGTDGSNGSASTSCPTDYLYVGGGTVNSIKTYPFCVSSHEMAIVGSMPVPAKGLTPQAGVSHEDARLYCAAAGKRLINNSEWAWVFSEVYTHAANWQSGVAPTDADYPALNIVMPTSVAPQLITGNINSGSLLAGEAASSVVGNSPTRRTYQLSNGIIHDFSGNLAEWTLDSRPVGTFASGGTHNICAFNSPNDTGDSSNHYWMYGGLCGDSFLMTFRTRHTGYVPRYSPDLVRRGASRGISSIGLAYSPLIGAGVIVGTNSIPGCATCGAEIYNNGAGKVNHATGTTLGKTANTYSLAPDFQAGAGVLVHAIARGGDAQVKAAISVYRYDTSGGDHRPAWWVAAPQDGPLTADVRYGRNYVDAWHGFRCVGDPQ